MICALAYGVISTASKVVALFSQSLPGPAALRPYARRVAVDGIASVVLAGGRSLRMGRAKAWLEWDGTTLLAHTCETLARATDGGPVVVVGSPGQRLPTLPAGVRCVDDPRPDRGPLQGIAAGLAAAQPFAGVAFVCATDLPLLHEAFVRRIVRCLEDDPSAEVAVPVVGGQMHPLAAAYRCRLAAEAEAAVVNGRLRVKDFVAGRRIVTMDEDLLLADPELAGVDPQLTSVVNVNDPAQLARARDVCRG